MRRLRRHSKIGLQKVHGGAWGNDLVSVKRFGASELDLVGGTTPGLRAQRNPTTNWIPRAELLLWRHVFNSRRCSALYFGDWTPDQRVKRLEEARLWHLRS